MPRKRLGELLVDTGLIDEDDLLRALEEQEEWGGPLGQIMVELGLVKEMDLVYVLSRQLNIPVADLEGRSIPQKVLDLVPSEFCQQHSLLPFHHEPIGNFLDVAMVEPLDMDTLERLRVMTKANVRPHFTTYSTLARMLRRHYDVEINWQDSQREGIRYRPTGTLQLDAHARRVSGLGNPASAGAPVTELDFDHPQPSDEGPPAEDPAAAEQGQDAPADLQASLAALEKKAARLEERIAELGALLERDERVLRRMLGLLLDKEICTQAELEELLSD
jgi:hypothetical protein